MPNDFNLDDYLSSENIRIKKYYKSNESKLVGFETKQRFMDWYLHELYIHDCSCHYCGIKIFELRNLITSGMIRGRNVSNGGIRGLNFEIDRKNPFKEYNERNCALSCYYCNNDKSNTFDYELYKETIGPARGLVWRKLLKILEVKNDE